MEADLIWGQVLCCEPPSLWLSHFGFSSHRTASRRMKKPEEIFLCPFAPVLGLPCTSCRFFPSNFFGFSKPFIFHNLSGSPVPALSILSSAADPYSRGPAPHHHFGCTKPLLKSLRPTHIPFFSCFSEVTKHCSGASCLFVFLPSVCQSPTELLNPMTNSQPTCPKPWRHEVLTSAGPSVLP